MDGKNLRLTVGLVALALAIFLALLWQPARQVRLHQRHLLKAVEKRKWEAVEGFIGAEYHDRWGHDKENVIGQASPVFGQFLFCNIAAEEHSLILGEGAGTIGVRLAMTGSGGPVAEMVKQRVNSLTEPFTFKWAHRSWKPWDWELIAADQPQLDIAEMPDL